MSSNHPYISTSGLKVEKGFTLIKLIIVIGKMNQCVPCWDVDDRNSVLAGLDYEVAELTWKNGQVAMQGLGQPRIANWDKPLAGGTLEAIVDQATHNRALVNPTTMDALVPCSYNALDSGACLVGCSTRVGSCSGVDDRAGFNSCDTYGSTSESATCDRDSLQLTAAFTSTNISDSVCHSSRRLRNKLKEDCVKRITGKSSILTKRSRATAIHNQSERKRRDRINQRMKTLQRLVPNSSKTDKASMLDEVIEYVKQLQSHAHIMRMNFSPIMLPMQQQKLQMGMSMNALGRSPFMPIGMSTWDNPGEGLPTPAAAPMMTDPMSAFFAWQSQLMTIDAYNRFAALYQQFQQPPGT